MKVDILAFLISLGSALSWLLLFWTWIGLGRVWRRACFAMVGHGLEGEGLPRDISGFIQSDLRSRPRLTDVQVGEGTLTVTVDCSAAKPCCSRHDAHGVRASFSATQAENFIGVPMVSMSLTPG